MKSTVVIPNYNGIDYLRECLNSLLECEPLDFSIIVVDNGSSDGSVELLREKYPTVDLIAFDENTGFARAVNAGIEAAVTEYVVLLNNDTVVDKGFVAELEKTMDSSDKILSASAKMIDMHNRQILDGTGDYYCALGWAYAYGKGKSVDAYTKKRRIFSSCGGAAIYRRKELIDIGAFDDNHFAYLEDIDVGYRARINGFYNVYSPDALVYHAGSGSSGSRYNEFKINLSSRNSIYLVLKNMPFLQLVINLPLLIVGFAVKALFFTLKGYGSVYIKGLMAGIKMYFGKAGREKRVKFRLRNLGNYIIIQLELWVNILRRLFA